MNSVYVTNQQKFTDNFDFVNEYFKLLTQYYSTWIYGDVRCTYYSLDIENSVIDDTQLMNGSYEPLGKLSGWRWRKILDLPLANIEALSTTPTADDKGVTTSEKMTTAWLSNIIQIECHIHDFVVFSECQNSDNYYLRNPPVFEVVNVERSPDFDNAFYKISLKVCQHPQKELDTQINSLIHYFDYEKRMYGVDNSIILNSLLNERKNNCCNSFYNDNTGLYFDVVDFRCPVCYAQK